jgi:pimeloyl-ACP methyl ester carboxylesterase
MRPHTYGRQTADTLFEEDALVRLANMPTARDYQAQLYGLIYWSVYSKLSAITAPSLVMHGLEDALIPADNGRLLASRIPGAQLVELPTASHWLMTDASAACIETLQQHLTSITP